MPHVAFENEVRPQLERQARELHRRTGGGLLQFDMQVQKPDPVAPPVRIEREDMRPVRFPCCGETILALPADDLFCVICGRRYAKSDSEKTKVFLSHKGADEPTVRHVKATLERLGYAPWLDEVAMVAGRSWSGASSTV